MAEDTDREESLLDAYSQAVVGVAERVSPADRAGVKVGDMIIGLDDAIVKSIDDLHRLLTEKPVGKPLPLTILRRAEKLVLEITPSGAESS